MLKSVVPPAEVGSIHGGNDFGVRHRRGFTLRRVRIDTVMLGRENSVTLEAFE